MSRPNAPEKGVRPRGLGRVVRSGLARRKVQTVLMGIAALMASTAAVVAGTLMVASSAPFDQAFASQHGAHLVARIDDGRASAAQIAATGALHGVTRLAGPYRTATVDLVGPQNIDLGPLNLVGRAEAGGTLDRLHLDSGRWATGPGEIVLSADLDSGSALGTQLRSRAAQAGSPTRLTVVGFARSVDHSADGWLAPAEVDTLRAGGATGGVQMLYRFDDADASTAARITADRRALASALPAGALVGATSYLDIRQAVNAGSAATVPFILAFGILGLVMSVVVVAGVVSGAVGASLHRIGVLKAIGFTPRQVVRAYVAQALIPGAVGTAFGVVLGNLVAMPLLSDAQQAFGTGVLTGTWWVGAAVAAGLPTVVVLAALVPAARAGRLRTVEVLAAGRGPRSGRGRRAQRLTARLPLPRPVTMGLAGPFARPARSAAMLAAVAFGTMAATFAVGLTSSLNAIGAAESPGSSINVTVDTGAHGSAGAPQPAGRAAAVQATPASIAQTGRAVAAQRGTAEWVGITHARATVQGIAVGIQTELFTGDDALEARSTVSGHWLTGPGQLVVPSEFLRSGGLHLGDTVTVTLPGATRQLRIVGEAFAPNNGGMQIFGRAGDFAAARPALVTELYGVRTGAGVSPTDYVTELGRTVQPLGATVVPGGGGGRHAKIIMLDVLAGLLSLMLVVVAGLGVLNTVVLDTRERVRDLGVCKALGMTPRQTVASVLASVAGIGVAGGLLGVPAGTALHAVVMPLVGRRAGTALPVQVLSVYHLAELAALGLGGLTIALLGALLPAGWAARARTARALRAE